MREVTESASPATDGPDGDADTVAGTTQTAEDAVTTSSTPGFDVTLSVVALAIAVLLGRR